MTLEITKLLADNRPSVYLYGSSCPDDFRPGWSDIDILVLTENAITEEQAGALLHLRQKLLSKEHGNPYYRSFEGGMLTLSALLTGRSIGAQAGKGSRNITLLTASAKRS